MTTERRALRSPGETAGELVRPFAAVVESAQAVGRRPSRAGLGVPGSPVKLHTSYALVVGLLVATALPIQFPTLRAELIGGYGREIATVHEWAGVAMLALPVAVFAAAPRRAVRVVSVRSSRRTGLHVVNLWFTILAGIGFMLSGFLMWFHASLPHVVVDTSADAHLVLSYALYVMIPLHLISVRKSTGRALKKRTARVRRALVRGRFDGGRRDETEDPTWW